MQRGKGLNGDGFIQRGGAILRYRTEGEGQPLLVIGSSAYYPPVFSRSLRSSLELIFVDLRHFSESDDETGSIAPTLEDYTGDIEAFRQYLALDSVIILGHSHHGNLAIEYARRFPQYVSAVVLVGTPPANVAETLDESADYWQRHANARRRSLLQSRRAMLSSDNADFISRYVADAPMYWYDPEYDAGWLWRDVPVNGRVLEAFKQFFVDYDFSASAADLSMPVLAVVGCHDYIVPPTLWRQGKKRFSDLTFHCLDRCGHTPPLEVPEQFDGVLLKWVSQISANAK